MAGETRPKGSKILATYFKIERFEVGCESGPFRILIRGLSSCRFQPISRTEIGSGVIGEALGIASTNFLSLDVQSRKLKLTVASFGFKASCKLTADIVSLTLMTKLSE